MDDLHDRFARVLIDEGIRSQKQRLGHEEQESSFLKRVRSHYILHAATLIILETEPPVELNLTSREVRRKRAEPRVIDVRGGRRIEVRVIEQVEHLRADLEHDALGNPRLLYEVYIHLGEAGTGTALVQSMIAQRTGAGVGEDGRTGPERGRPGRTAEVDEISGKIQGSANW